MEVSTWTRTSLLLKVRHRSKECSSHSLVNLAILPPHNASYPAPHTDFKPLYRYSTVMGMESQPDITQDLPTGICNAIILAQPYAPFIVSLLLDGSSVSHADDC